MSPSFPSTTSPANTIESGATTALRTTAFFSIVTPGMTTLYSTVAPLSIKTPSEITDLLTLPKTTAP